MKLTRRALLNEIATLTAQRDDAQATVTRLESENIRLRRTAEADARTIATLQTEREQLRRVRPDVDLVQAIRLAHRAEVAELKVTQLEKRLEGMKRRARGDLAEREAVIGRLRSQLAGLEARFPHLFRAAS